MLNSRKLIFVFISCLIGFSSYLLVVLLGELLSGTFNLGSEFRLEPIHFQIGLLGGILQGSLYLFKSQNKSL
jgi:hypothetical protein